MAKTLMPRQVFDRAQLKRADIPLLSGNPYKLAESAAAIGSMLGTAKAVLDFELNPRKGCADKVLGNHCVVWDRRSWVSKSLRELVAKELGYRAVPGLAAMGHVDLTEKFTAIVLNDLLPDATSGLARPKGAPMAECLVNVLERSKAAMNSAMAELGLPHD